MKELKNYFREIKAALPCSGSKRKMILRDLRLSVENFLEENPDATFGAVVEHFGTPQQIADTYTEEMPPEEVQRRLKTKKWIIGIVAGTAVCVLLMWLIAIILAFVEQSKIHNGYHEEDPIIVEEDIVWEE